MNSLNLSVNKRTKTVNIFLKVVDKYADYCSQRDTECEC